MLFLPLRTFILQDTIIKSFALQLMIVLISIVLAVLDLPFDLERRGFVDPDWVTNITVDVINRRGRAHIRRSRHPLSSLNSDRTDHPVSDGTVETGNLSACSRPVVPRPTLRLLKLLKMNG